MTRTEYIRREAGRHWLSASMAVPYGLRRRVELEDAPNRDAVLRRLVADEAVSIAASLADALGLRDPEPLLPGTQDPLRPEGP